MFNTKENIKTLFHLIFGMVLFCCCVSVFTLGVIYYNGYWFSVLTGGISFGLSILMANQYYLYWKKIKED